MEKEENRMTKEEYLKSNKEGFYHINKDGSVSWYEDFDSVSAHKND